MGLMRYDSSVAECCCSGFRECRNAFNASLATKTMERDSPLKAYLVIVTNILYLSALFRVILQRSYLYLQPWMATNCEFIKMG